MIEIILIEDTPLKHCSESIKNSNYYIYGQSFQYARC